MPPETDNLQLQDIFDEDQKDREKVYETAEEVRQLRERDRLRRRRIYAMMDLGEVRTKNDLYHAAVVLQHGEEHADFLVSHRLACMSAVMGHRMARWLMAASLDRYLMSEKRPQIYGTQFQYNPDVKQYELRLPIQDQGILTFEKEFLGVPQIAARLRELNSRIQAKRK